MSTSMVIAIITIVASLLGALLYIIYNNLNKDISKNEDHIKEVKEMYATKKEFDSYKVEHTREHDKQDEAYEKLDRKLDRIIQMLLERKNEK